MHCAAKIRSNSNFILLIVGHSITSHVQVWEGESQRESAREIQRESHREQQRATEIFSGSLWLYAHYQHFAHCMTHAESLSTIYSSRKVTQVKNIGFLAQKLKLQRLIYLFSNIWPKCPPSLKHQLDVKCLKATQPFISHLFRIYVSGSFRAN